MYKRATSVQSYSGKSRRKVSARTKPTPMQHNFDEEMMRRAIELARRGVGRVEPNPMVGCVLVGGGQVIAEGFHKRFGGPHAEIVALRGCEYSARGATAYVTLEPCCHHGKTPPCVEALIEAGVSRVVVGVGDPSSLVAGRGLRKLRRAEIRVEVGVEKRAAEELIAPFATVQTLGRPYVIAKWAQGLDGGLVPPPGESPWISCETSRKFAHRLRARVDAILVGSKTAFADDPLLTARGVLIRRVATRVVLDTRLRIAPSSKLVETSGETPTVVFTTSQRARSRKAKTLAGIGVEVVAVRERKRGLCLTDVMQNLARRGMTNVLVEGGPSVLDSFLRKKIVDEAFVFVAPRLVGSKASRGGNGRITASLRPQGVEAARSGVDLRYRWRLTSVASH